VVQIRQIRILIKTLRIRNTGVHLFIYAKLKAFIISKQCLAQKISLFICQTLQSSLCKSSFETLVDAALYSGHVRGFCAVLQRGSQPQWFQVIHLPVPVHTYTLKGQYYEMDIVLGGLKVLISTLR